MNYLREHVLEPIILPLVAVALIAFGALNLSRLFLASASAGRAVVVATAISAAILGVAAWASSRDHIDRGVLFGGAAMVGLALSGAGVIAQQVDADHQDGGHEEPPASAITFVATNFDFAPPDEDTAGPRVEVNLTTEEGAHTWVVEGHEGDFKLEAGEGATDTGEIELEPGDYIFYCDVVGHREAGMEGALTITEGGGAEEGTGSEEPAGEVIEVVAANTDFPTNEFAATAGEITFDYVNEDSFPHTLVVDGREDDMLIEAAGGETSRGSIDLEAGTYTLYCDIPGHREAGMEGVLTVT